MDLPIIATSISLFVFLLASIPIGIAIGLSVILGLLVGDLPAEFLIQKVVLSLDSFPLLAVPFFILAGEIMQKGSMANSLLNLSRCLVGHITGGLAHVSILTCLFYGALSGSSPATVAAVGGIMIPAMEKEGYPKDFSTAVNTAGGCLGVMIPPSVPLIIYGTTANVSVGDLFIAGIIPGLFLGLLLILICYFIAKKRNYPRLSQRATFKMTLLALNDAKYSLMVPLIVLGGIYGGITTPTEAGAIAVLYALFIETCVYRHMTFGKLTSILKDAALTNASIFIVVAMASALGQMLMIYNVPDLIVQYLSDMATNKYLLLFAIMILLLIMGTFMDALANILILTPLLLPLVIKAGVDLTHFGVFMIATVSVGFLTPPVGVNLFVACGISKLSIEKLSYAVLPFIGIIIVGILLIAYIPQITLFLL